MLCGDVLQEKNAGFIPLQAGIANAHHLIPTHYRNPILYCGEGKRSHPRGVGLRCLLRTQAVQIGLQWRLALAVYGLRERLSNLYRESALNVLNKIVLINQQDHIRNACNQFAKKSLVQ